MGYENECLGWERVCVTLPTYMHGAEGAEALDPAVADIAEREALTAGGGCK
jgi:hypothetical protein